MRTLSLTFTFLMAIGAVALGTNASADTLTGTLGQPLRESSHSVDVRVKHGVATYTVKRTFVNLGTRHEEAQLRIRLPFGASVSGLRIRGKSKWHRGELMHVDSARSLYRELTGMGPHLPRDPALLQWVSADQAHLHLFPIAPQSASTVEYTLTVPTRYRDGEYILFYPMASGAKNLTSPVIRFVGSRKYARMVFDGTPTKQGEPNVGANQLATSPLLEGDTPMVIPDAPSDEGELDMHTMKVSAEPIRVVSGRLGRVNVIKGKNFQRFELDVAKEIGIIPRGISVVFVIDLSRSQTSETVSAQFELARAYLGKVPSASFQLVGYRRFAVDLSSTFRPSGEFDAVVERLKNSGALELGNGSSLDAGLARSKSLLAKRKGTRRVVVASDQMLRPSWKNSDALVNLPTNAVIHVVDVSPRGGASSSRLENAGLAEVAKASGGIMLRFEGARLDNRKHLEGLALQLVRPIQIDNVKVAGAELDLQMPDVLHEGDSVRIMVGLKRAASKVVLQGRLWSTPYRKTIRSNSRFDRISAGYVFSHDMHNDLSDQEQFKLAMYAHALSPMTGFLAIEPGVRPSIAGIERVQGGVVGGVIGGVIGGVLGGTLGRGRPAGYWQSMFVGAKERCVSAHKPPSGWTLRVNVHMTYAEIVDVDSSENSSLSTCIVEAAWKLRPEWKNHPERKHSWALTLRSDSIVLP